MHVESTLSARQLLARLIYHALLYAYRAHMQTRLRELQLAMGMRLNRYIAANYAFFLLLYGATAAFLWGSG